MISGSLSLARSLFVARTVPGYSARGSSRGTPIAMMLARSSAARSSSAIAAAMCMRFSASSWNLVAIRFSASRGRREKC